MSSRTLPHEGVQDTQAAGQQSTPPGSGGADGAAPVALERIQNNRGTDRDFPDLRGNARAPVPAAVAIPQAAFRQRLGWVTHNPGNELPYLFKAFHSDPAFAPWLCNGLCDTGHWPGACWECIVSQRVCSSTPCRRSAGPEDMVTIEKGTV